MLVCLVSCGNMVTWCDTTPSIYDCIAPRKQNFWGYAQTIAGYVYQPACKMDKYKKLKTSIIHPLGQRKVNSFRNLRGCGLLETPHSWGAMTETKNCTSCSTKLELHWILQVHWQSVNPEVIFVPWSEIWYEQTWCGWNFFFPMEKKILNLLNGYSGIRV